MQSRIESAIERTLDITTGIILSWAIQAWILFPLLDIQATYTENAIIVGVLTVVSFIRGYVWRRVFNRITERKYADRYPRKG